MSNIDVLGVLKSTNGMMVDVTVLCTLDMIIEAPSHLEGAYDEDYLTTALFDVLSIRHKNKESAACGKFVSIVSKKSIQNITGSSVSPLILNGTFRLIGYDSTYVELTNTLSGELKPTRVLFNEEKYILESSDFKNSCSKFIGSGRNIFAYYDLHNFGDVIPMCVGEEFIKYSEGKDFLNSFMNSRKSKNSENDKVTNKVEKQSKNISNNKDKIISTNSDVVDKNNLSESVNAIHEKAEINKAVWNDIVSKLKKSTTQIQETLKGIYQLKSLCSIEEQLVKFGEAMTDYESSDNSETDIYDAKVLLQYVLEKLYPDYSDRYIHTKKGNEVALTNYFILNYSDVFFCGDKYDLERLSNQGSFEKLIVSERERVFIGIIDNLLGCMGRLVDVYDTASDKYKSIFYNIITNNPYYLTFLSGSIRLSDMDMLALLYNVSFLDKTVLEIRGIAEFHSLMLDTSRDAIKSNSFVLKRSLKRDDWFSGGFNNNLFKIVVGLRNYEYVKKNKCLLSEKVLNTLGTYVYQDLDKTRFNVPNTDWKKIYVNNVEKRVREMSLYYRTNTVTIQDKFELYLESGLGIEYNYDNELYVADFLNIYREVSVVSRLDKINKNSTISHRNASKDKINDCIDNFVKVYKRKNSSFELEPEQIRACDMLNTNVFSLTGAAGSGKTTVVKLFISILKEVYGYSDEEIVLCAPTGRAANRLREVTGKSASTLHSFFGLSFDSGSILTVDKQKIEGVSVLIVDESSMIDLELMFKLPNNIKIIFVGDMEQLPPIGVGKPFVDILSVFPSIRLGKTKRSVEGSALTVNANMFIDDTVEDLEFVSDDSIKFLPMSKLQGDRIRTLVSNIVKQHTYGSNLVDEKYILDSVGTNIDIQDIQVISPIKGDTWGVRTLNNKLQEVVNPSSRKSGTVLKVPSGFSSENSDYTYFKIKDRVMHLSNDSKKVQYRYKGSWYSVRQEEGVMNGDMGVIVDILPGYELNKKVQKKKEYKNKKRSDDYLNIDCSNNVYYVVVKYPSITGKVDDDYFIMYRVRVDKEEMDGKLYVHTCKDSYDLKALDLAYAVTVHKMQGSQAKLIILLLYPVGLDFISRNLVYTSMTRATDYMYVIGDVGRSDNILVKARDIKELENRFSLVDMLIK